MATNPQPPVTLDALIGAVVSHSPDGGALVHLRDAVLVAQFLDEQADQLVGHFVDEARQDGASWTTIGQSLGVSKQAAQQRFVPADDDEGFVRGPFTRFTPRARQAVANAREDARRLAAGNVESSHLVLGLLSEKKGIAAKALAAQGVTLAAAEARFANPARAAKSVPSFARETKKVMQLSLREALKLGHNYIGTEHLLLAVLASKDGPGAELLGELGVDPEKVRDSIDELLSRARR